jgi:hypothetical protein
MRGERDRISGPMGEDAYSRCNAAKLSYMEFAIGLSAALCPRNFEILSISVSHKGVGIRKLP